MPFRPRALFLDAGHTLLEPIPRPPDVYLQKAAALGIAVDPAPFHAHMLACWRSMLARGRGNDDLSTSEEAERAAWRTFTGMVAEPFPALRAQHERWLTALVAHFDAPQAWALAPGALEIIDRARAAGLIIGVISNWHSALHGILRGLAVRDHLDFVVISAELGRRKPHLEIFREALRRAGVNPEEAVHVGDSVRDDVEGAAAAGIRPVLLSGAAPEEQAPAGVLAIERLADLGRVLDLGGRISAD